MKKVKNEEVENFYTKKTGAKNVPKKKIEKLKNNEILVDVIKEKPKKSAIKKKVKTNQKNLKEKKQNKEKTKKRKVVSLAKQQNRIKIVKWTSISIIIITAIVLFMISSVFNIKSIIVSNNSKISTNEIINNSNIQIGQNIFKINKKNIKEGIKQNAYIENVKITRNITTMTLNIEVEEREPTYAIMYANAFVYLNNQGYILETTDVPIDKPILLGTNTPEQNMEAGKRLDSVDLYRLEGVLKIIEAAKSYGIEKTITSIDISDETNYKLDILNGEKIVYFGHNSNVNEKVRLIEQLIKTEEGINGEFFINEMDEGDKVFFRERVQV